MLQLPVSPRSRRVRVSAATTAAIVAVSLLGVSPASAVPNAAPPGAGPLPVVYAGLSSTSPPTAETSTITGTSPNDTTTTGTTTTTTPPESPGPAVSTLDWTGTPSARNVATPAAREQQIPLDGCGAHGPAAATAKARALVRQIRSRGGRG